MGSGISHKIIYQFEEICKAFILPNQRQTINISGKIRQKILDIYNSQKSFTEWNYEKEPIQVLEEARFSVFNDLKFDAFPRFINSDEGYNIISKLKDDGNVISPNSLHSVINKMMDSFMVSKFENNKDVEDYAFILSNPQMLKENYLNYDWSKVEEFETKLKKSFIYKESKESSSISKNSFTGKLKVKIVLFAKRKQPLKKSGLFDFLSPINIGGKSDDDLGLENEFKTILMMGPFYLEWNETELCIPKLVLNEVPIMSFDISEIPDLNTFGKLSTKLSEEIIKWNTTMKYQLNSLDKEKYGNSQDFVDSIIKAIDIKLDLPEPTKNFLNQMREFGDSTLKFTVNKEFQEKFEIPQSIVFKNHQEIDELMLKLLIKEPNFKTLYSGHFHLLKCFDRTFWMRELYLKNRISSLNKDVEKEVKDKNNLIKEMVDLEEELNTIKGKKNVKCPFKDPTRSYSIIPFKEEFKQ